MSFELPNWHENEKDQATGLMKHNCNCNLQMVLLQTDDAGHGDPEQRWVDSDTAAVLLLLGPHTGDNPKPNTWTDEEWASIENGLLLMAKHLEISEFDILNWWYIKEVRQPGQSHFHGMCKIRVHFPEQS
jgi:hypothetical protein